MICVKCNGSGKRALKNGNIGLCLRCLGAKEIGKDELNDQRFYRNMKKQNEKGFT